MQEVSETDILIDILNKHIVNYRSYTIIFEKNIPVIKSEVNFKVAITEMYPRVPSELFVVPLGSKECTLGTTGLQDMFRCLTQSLGDFNMGHNYINHTLLSL